MRVRLRLDRLQELLASTALSQNHWALRVGLSRGHWSEIVNGKHPYPSPKTRNLMLEAFGVSLEELFAIEPGGDAWGGADFQAAIADRYLIDRELGQGGMGAVYLARDIQHGRPLVLKVIAPEAVSGVGMPQFLREISTAAHLQHPHILPMFDSGVAAGRPFYVMPWVRHGSLRDRLAREPRLPLPEVTRLVSGIAQALDYAHTQRVLHCDIKPENILLQDGHAWVMDFGIARSLQSEGLEWRKRRELDLSAGTPAYVSPEQANGDEDLDGRSDVYSLACVVFELVTGRPPFEGSTTQAVVASRFLSPPPSARDVAPDLPKALDRALRRGMARNRDHRPATAGDFAAEVTSACAHASRPWPAFRAWVATRFAILRSRLTGRLGRSSGALGPGALAGLRQDVALAWRGLRRAPAFSLAVVLTLGLGVGGGASFLSLVDRLLLRPPPLVVDPGSLRRAGLTGTRLDGSSYIGSSLAWVDYLALQRASTTLVDVAAFKLGWESLGLGVDAREVLVGSSTASFLPLLGVRPAQGRFFTEDEDVLGAGAGPCVLSDQLWRRQFDRDPKALGSQLLIGGIPCTIVGITPPGFVGVEIYPVDIWVPVKTWSSPTDATLWTDRSHWINIVGRLREGVPLARAEEDATRAYRTELNRTRDPTLKNTMVWEPLQRNRGSNRSSRIDVALWLAAGGVLLVLLVTANLTNLYLVRSLRGARETAARIALGAGWKRLFRAHAAEVLLLSLIGAGLALILVRLLGNRLQHTLAPGATLSPALIDVRVAGVALGLALLVGLTVTALVTLQARRQDPATLMRTAGTHQMAGTRRSRRFRLVLVAVQAALSSALLLASAAFVQSFRRGARFDVGFDPQGLVSVSIAYNMLAFPERQTVRQEYRDLQTAVRGYPGVETASLGYTGPWASNRTEVVSIPGRDSLPPAGNFGRPLFDAVTPEYVETMRLTMRAGRFVSPDDREATEPVVVVNQALADLYWPGRSPLGECMRVGDAEGTPCRTIVGVTANQRVSGRFNDPATPSYYVPLAQAGGYGFTPHLFVRVRGEAGGAIAALPGLRRFVQQQFPSLPAADVHLVADDYDPMIAPWRLGALAFTALGGLAIVVALGGLATLLYFGVAERYREFAIRSALGAQAAHVVRPVVRQAAAIAVAGLAVGLAAALVARRWIDPLLFRTSLLDPATVALLSVVFLVVAVVVSFGPAQRAAKVDPMVPLREQ